VFVMKSSLVAKELVPRPLDDLMVFWGESLLSTQRVNVGEWLWLNHVMRSLYTKVNPTPKQNILKLVSGHIRVIMRCMHREISTFFEYS